MAVVEITRDLIIIIFGLVAIIAIVFGTLLFFRIYRETRVVLNSWKSTSESIRNMSTRVEDEILRPILQIVSIVQGVRQGIDVVTRMFRKEEEKEEKAKES